MADWRKAITNDITTKPDEPPYDPTKGRQKLAKLVEKAERQISQGKTKVPNKLWRTRYDGDIVFNMVLNGHVITVKDADGEVREEFGIPQDQVNEVLTGLAKAIRETDEWDDQIEAALAFKGPVSSAKVSRKGQGRSGPRQSTLPERSDKIPHRVPASEDQPHPSYELNKSKTYWRSPEQVAADEKSAAKRKASMEANA